jgi:hypothetical protein
VKGGNNKITQFQEMVGALQEFNISVHEKGECILHYNSFTNEVHGTQHEAMQHLQGRFKGFIGDRTLMRNPTPILLPNQKTWQ